MTAAAATRIWRSGPGRGAMGGGAAAMRRVASRPPAMSSSSTVARRYCQNDVEAC